MSREERSGNTRRGRREGRGIVSVLIGTALLAVLGFGLGIVAGLVMEEPGLLLDYVTGKTQPAPLEDARGANEFAASERERERDAADAPPPVDAAPAIDATDTAANGAATPDVSAPPSEFEAAKGTDEFAADAEPVSEAVAAPTPVQVAAAPPAAPKTAEKAPAKTEADAQPAAKPSAGGYSVQVGALADAASAEQLAVKLRKKGFAVYVAPSAEPSAKRWRVRVGPVKTREQADALVAKLEREKLPTWVLAEGPR